ncbi:MAG: hypothetical protein J2P45_02615 [Candidatus Dormibacteraeota bacterium]|nr:hypothetical protein [Candidatus Dormibacteraeota bacterium]
MHELWQLAYWAIILPLVAFYGWAWSPLIREPTPSLGDTLRLMMLGLIVGCGALLGWYWVVAKLGA